MTLQRDLVWQNMDMSYRSSIAHQFARYALGLNYKMLPQSVVHQAKRCLLDTLGCAIGAYESPGRSICETVVQELGGTEEAILIGLNKRSTVLNATLYNSFLVRFLDFNDVGGGAHNSDSIPGIIATAERENACGSDLITSIVISYELGARVKEATRKSWGESGGMEGWTPDVRGGVNMPPALGKLMDLNESQIANAIGICASHSLPLGVLDTNNEENTMSKNLRFGFVAYNAVLSSLLAKHGFTGPLRVIEGENGLRDVIFRGNLDYNILTDFSGWRILQTRHKFLPANISSIGHVLATLAIVQDHNLAPEQVESVCIKAGLRETLHTTYAAKKYPRNAESADHSAFYMNAVAIIDKTYGPDAFNPLRFDDPDVLDLIEKITVEPDPALPESGLQGISEITTKDGRKYVKVIENPHGFDDDPLTDAELEDKFAKMATKFMKDKQIRNIYEIIWNLEELKNVKTLTELLSF